jgi:hypothetical protein
VAFGTMGAERIFATTTAANIGSRRVMEKLGMFVTWVAVPADDADPDLAEVEYELARVHWELGQAPTIPIRRIVTDRRAPGGRHRLATTSEFTFIATGAG